MRPGVLDRYPLLTMFCCEQRSLYPTEGTIQLNLACYEAQFGNIEKAKQHLEQAIAVHPVFKVMALQDEDLKPLWNELSVNNDE